MFRFPRPLAEIILSYSIEWTMIPAILQHIPASDRPDIPGDITPWRYWRRLSLNPHGVDHLDRHPELIDWRLIAANPAASHLIWSEYMKKRFPSFWCERNKSGAGKGNRPIWLSGQRYYVNIAMLCRNPSETAIEVLKTLPLGRLVWDQLSTNTHPWAIAMLLKYPGKIRKDLFQANPAAAPYLANLGWLESFNTAVSSNPNKKLSAYLRENPVMIHPKGAIRNPELVDIFFDNNSRVTLFLARPRWWSEIGTLFDFARNPNLTAIKAHVTTGSRSSFDRWKTDGIICWDDLIANPGIFELKEPLGLRDLLMRF